MAPRLPVDGKRVIEHRISLSGVEREQLENFVMGYNVRNVAQPLVALLSDVSAILTLTGILQALGVINLEPLARKLGGQGQAWIEAVLSGAFDSLDAALLDFEERQKELYPDWLPGGDPAIDPYVPPSEYTLSTSERMWAMTQIYSQQAASFSSPGQAYGGP